MDINHRKRIQRLATRLVTGMRHHPYEERLQRPGHHSLKRRRLRADLITAFKIFKGLLDIHPSRSMRPKRHPYKVLQGASHHQRGGSAFSVMVVKYWKKPPPFSAPSVNIFKKRVAKVWTEIFPHLPINLPPPKTSATPPINRSPRCKLPYSLLYNCGFFRPIVT